MATIEERMLQRNVPGRFSSWADEADDAEDRSRAASDSEPEEDVVDNDDEGPAATAPVNDDDGLVALEYRRGHNTGPKAVLADHQAHQRAAYERREQAKAHRAAMLHRIAHGAEAEEDSDEEEGEEEDDFLRRYREQRLLELQSATTTTSSSSSNRRSRRLRRLRSTTRGETPRSCLGALETAGAYTDLLRRLDDAQASGTPVVVLVHSPHVPGSRALHNHLAALAPRLTGTHFIVAPGSALPGVFDAAMLPVLIAYDAKGDVIESLPCADEALEKGGGHGVKLGDVVWWLESVVEKERRDG